MVTLTVVVLWRSFSAAPFLESFQRTPLDLPYTLFVVGRTVSVFFSTHPSLSYPALTAEYFFYIVFFLTTQTVRRDQLATARALTFLLVLAGALAGTIGALWFALAGDERASSTSAGPYTLGAYLCAVLPLALFARSGRPRKEIWWLLILPICLGIFLTLDRLHWAGMMFALAIALFVRRDRTRWVFSAAALAAFALSMISPSFQLRVAYMTAPGVFFTGRDVLWQGAWEVIRSHPLTGFGPRTFSEVFPLFAQMHYGVGSWHNDYLQVYMESGLLALLPLFWLIGTVYYYGIRTVRKNDMIPALLLSLTVVFLVGGMLDTLVGITFRVVLGLFALLVRNDGPSIQTAIPLAPRT